MGKLRVRFRHEVSNAALGISIERMSDGAQFNFAARPAAFLPMVVDQESIFPLRERLPQFYNGQGRYRKLYCLDLPIDREQWADGEYMVCVHDLSPGTQPEALEPAKVVIRDGDDCSLQAPGSLSFMAELLFYSEALRFGVASDPPERLAYDLVNRAGVLVSCFLYGTAPGEFPWGSSV